MKKKVSIHDIARHLNVSSATVSLVLNGKAEKNHIRKEVSDKILAYVKETGYRPNMVAKSLRTGKTRIIGMLVEEISNPFFSSIASIVENEAYQAGYKLFYSSTENDTAKASALITAFRERQVDAYIIVPAPGIESEIQSLIDDRYPLVLFDRNIPSLPASNVIIDNYGSSQNAVQHLLNNHYQRIAMVTLESDQLQMTERERGFREAMKAARKTASILKVDYHTPYEKTIKIIERFMKEHPEVDAMLFATNYLALAGLEAIKNRKLAVPDDMAVVAFDDNSHFNLFSPSITAVAQPVKEIAHEIIRQLKRQLSGTEKDIRRQTSVLKTELVIRESSLPKKNIVIKEKPAGVNGKKHRAVNAVHL